MAAAYYNRSGDRDRFLQKIKDTVDDCYRIGTTDTLQKNIFDDMRARLNSLQRDIERSVGDFLSDDEAKNFLETIENIQDEIENNQSIEKKEGYKAKRIRIDEKGHYRFDITKEQLEFLSKFGFTAPMMSEIFGVSESTIRRRLRNFNMSLKKTTILTNEDLDEVIREVVGTNRQIGPNTIRVRLAENDIFVTRQRVRDACARVDPGGCALTSLERKNIRRRTYKVAGSNSLWHFDGNHKLIRWNIVIHGCVDGYSRMITYMKADSNNKARTVFNNFIDAIKQYDTPSRVRCDYGVENVEVCAYMEGIRGSNRGSAIRGKSCHNQRIERLWVDVWDNVTNEFYDLFSFMEQQNILDITNPHHMYTINYVFLPRINERIKSFIFQYNNHPISTEHNKTPNQLFIKGVLANAKSHLQSIEELIQEAGSTSDNYYEILADEYGAEEVDNSDDDNNDSDDVHHNDDANISAVGEYICDDQKQAIMDLVDPFSNLSSLEYGQGLFKRTIEILNEDVRV